MRSAGCLWAGLFLAAASVAHAERLPIQTFTAADGLANDRVKCIVPDSRGRLWFCSAGGIDWFDGRRFVGHALDDGLAFSTNDVLEAPDHIYWIATNGRGVARFDPAGEHVAAWPPARSNVVTSRLRRYTVGETAATNRVNKLFRDRSGALWAGTDDGLFRLEAAGRFRSVTLPVSTNRHVQIWSFAETADGALWIGTSIGLFRRVASGAIAQAPLRASSHGVLSLLATDDGTLWIGDSEGLSRASAGRTEEEGFHAVPVGIVPSPKAVGALYKTRSGAIWIGYVNGPLIRYDGSSFQQYTREQGLPEAGVWTLAVDAEDNVWMATGSGGGVVRILKAGFWTYGRRDGLQHELIQFLITTRAGDVCAQSGTDADPALQCFDGRRFVNVRPQLPSAATGWHLRRRVLQARDGSWWFATAQGLYRFPPVRTIADLARARPSAVYTTAQGLPAANVTGLFEDSRGDLWMWGASRDGYAVSRWLHAADRVVPVDGVHASKQVYECGEDSRGDVWMGFRDGGLARWHEGRVQIFGPEAGYPNGWIGSLYSDRLGRLWIGTTGMGYLRIDEPSRDPPRFVPYSPAPSLSNPQSGCCFLEDQWGNLYIVTAGGIERLDADRNWFAHYDSADGLGGTQIWGAVSDRTGALWYATDSGVARLIPENVNRPAPADVLIYTFRIAGSKYPLSLLGEADVPRVNVPLGSSPIDIEYASAAGNVQYQYRLEGADTDWQRPATDGSITFVNLPAGSYRFAIRAVRRGSVAFGRPATVAFTIVPPFWQRRSFLGALAVLLIAMAYAAHRYRLARLLELERIRTRIATDLHDDIGSSLSRIAILSEVASRRPDRTATDVGDTLDSIARTAGELVDSMSDIVWAINPRQDALEDLTGRMRRFASDLLTARNIAFRFEAPGRDGEIRLGPDLRREVYLTFKEGLNNIVRHSRCTEVAAALRVHDGSLELTLSDNGIGFDAGGDATGHGLVNLRARSAALQGALEIRSEAGHGTLLRLRLPLRARRSRLPHLFRW